MRDGGSATFEKYQLIGSYKKPTCGLKENYLKIIDRSEEHVSLHRYDQNLEIVFLQLVVMNNC